MSRGNKYTIIQNLHQPRPELFPYVLWRRLVVGIRLDLGDSAVEVHLERRGHGLTVVELGTNVEDGEEDEGEVVGDKGVGRPLAFEEDCPAGELRRVSTSASGRAGMDSRSR